MCRRAAGGRALLHVPLFSCFLELCARLLIKLTLTQTLAGVVLVARPSFIFHGGGGIRWGSKGCMSSAFASAPAPRRQACAACCS